MSHYRGYVVSFDKRVKDPWMPDEETYNEQVNCDYCEVENLPKKELSDRFVEFICDILPDIPHAIYHRVLKDGTVKVVIPRGCIRQFLKKQVSEIKEKAGALTPDNFIHAAHDVHHLTDYVNPFTTVFVVIDDGGMEDFDTYRRALAFSLEDNDKKDTVVYVYGSINHHA